MSKNIDKLGNDFSDLVDSVKKSSQSGISDDEISNLQNIIKELGRKIQTNFTKNQIAIMEYTVSDNKRNWFGCDENSKDGRDFEELIKKGYAKKRTTPTWAREETIYSLTEKGLFVVKLWEL